MKETSNDNVVEVPPMANVYTVLVLVAVVALVVGIGAAGNRLMSKENGYGMEPGQLFEVPEQDPVSSGEPQAPVSSGEPGE